MDVPASPPLPQCTPGPCLNVLHIISDDMRADWGTFGLPVKTPNIDQLASEGLAFQHAYCQLSVCSPSRQSFLTSLRPDRNRVWNFIDANPLSTQALPGHFKQQGYLTLGLGKTFHEDFGAWNADAYWSTDALPYFQYRSNKCPNGNAGGGQCVEGDSNLYDYSLRLRALEYLRFAASTARNTSRPFFMMVGFRDPHAPWAAPQRMYDMYDESALRGPTHPTLDGSVPLIAWSRQLSVQLQNGTRFAFSPTCAVPAWVQRNQRHAYYAAVSYVDEHVGALMSELRRERLESLTIVLVHSDHGYSLGEHGYWEKKANFDMVVRVPLVLRVPGKAASAGRSTASIVELVDLFPTLAALAGLPAPADVDGTDVSSLLDDPTLVLKHAAYHQYPACNTTSVNEPRMGCNQTPRGQFDFMAYSVRTREWRYTLWLRWDRQRLAPLWDGSERAEELYEHKGDNSSDLDRWENVNVASSHPDLCTSFAKQLRLFFEAHGARAGNPGPHNSTVA